MSSSSPVTHDDVIHRPGYQSSPSSDSSRSKAVIKPFLTSNYAATGPDRQRDNTHLSLSSPRHKEPLSPSRALPLPATAHFPLFPAKNRGIAHHSQLTDTSQDRHLPDLRSGKHFITTPLPSHGPGASYGYTTTTSFVNVQFGGSSPVKEVYPVYPFTREIRPLNPLRTISTKTPVHQSDQQWSDISKYHLETLRTNGPSRVKNSHIKQSTVRPVLLPPLTPTLTRRKLTAVPREKKIFVKTPSLRFEVEKSRTVTLPPYINHIAPHQPGPVR